LRGQAPRTQQAYEWSIAVGVGGYTEKVSGSGPTSPQLRERRRSALPQGCLPNANGSLPLSVHPNAPQCQFLDRPHPPPGDMAEAVPLLGRSMKEILT
jgi:hypothetical protein